MELFTQQLIELKAYRKDREELANYILDNPDYFQQLLETCSRVDEDISYKAAWILEMVCLNNIQLLIPHLDKFLDNISKIYKPQAVRPMAKICEELTLYYYSKKETTIQFVLSKKQREQLTEICFD
ncbi:MAG: hypothetical protein WD554_07140 [Flavobacteriaceae bacterium]